MIRVHVRNFQSIAQSTIVIDGLTVVTGPNNSGKTALMRAIRGVFTNTKGSSFVRHGTDACEVTIEFADGNTVTWEKGKSLNRYTVNGKLLDKVGQGVPDEVAAMNVTEIQAGNQTVWPQIAPQFTGQVFLLDQPGSVIAEALADVERVGKLSRALKACDSDRRQMASELKVRRADQKALLTEMATFDGLDSALSETTAVEQQAAALDADRSRIEDLSDLSARLADLQQRVARLAGVQTVSVPAADQPTIIGQTAARLAEATALRDRLNTAKANRAKYLGADALACPTATDLTSAKQELDALLALQAKRNAAKATHARLAGFVVPDVDIGRAERAGKALEVLKGFKSRRDTCLSEVIDCNAQIGIKRTDLTNVLAEINTILAQMPSCPTCGQAHKDCP